jgi:hypothetical protein
VAIKNIAADLAGIPVEHRGVESQERFIERFAKVLFRGKK